MEHKKFRLNTNEGFGDQLISQASLHTIQEVKQVENVSQLSHD